MLLLWFISGIKTIECILRPHDVLVIPKSSEMNIDRSLQVKAQHTKIQGPKRKKRSLEGGGVIVTRPIADIRGHTAYLTFAKKLLH